MQQQIDSALREAIEFWDGFAVPVQWFISESGREALAVGDGFAWSLVLDENDHPHTSEAVVGPFCTGIVI